MSTQIGLCRGILLAALAVALLAAPARADYDTAVSAYETGSYQQAYREFKALAEHGDERAATYLERLQELGFGALGSSAGGSSASPGRGSGASDTGSSWNTSREGSGGLDIWTPLDGAEPPPPVSDIVVPHHPSVWSRLFHLPADATVIGLQYVAQAVSAEKLFRDLQIISHNADKIILGGLALVWWFLLMRLGYWIGRALFRLVRTMTGSWEQENYG